MMHGAVLWVTGLSGAGKSSVAGEVTHRLRARDCPAVLLDGDDLRWALGVQTAFDIDTRTQLAWVYARLCRLISAQGQVVVCATISLRHDVQRWNREHNGCYVEVLLDVPADELAYRTRRRPQSPGRREVVGVDLLAEFPQAPDLCIPNHPPLSAPAAADRIVEYGVTRRFW